MPVQEPTSPTQGGLEKWQKGLIGAAVVAAFGVAVCLVAKKFCSKTTMTPPKKGDGVEGVDAVPTMTPPKKGDGMDGVDRVPTMATSRPPCLTSLPPPLTTPRPAGWAKEKERSYLLGRLPCLKEEEED